MSVMTIHNHARDVAGYTYIYPVISRRAEGVSVGINLNPNNACNWACIYCQVPGLVRGDAPAIDLALLESELRGFLAEIARGNWLQENAPADSWVLQDIAFSGNGEPTSAAEFPQIVDIAGKLMDELELTGTIKLRLITNGSLMHREPVLDSLKKLAELNGEVWFKIDRATPDGMMLVNGVSTSLESVIRRLRACSGRCPTWIQTCWFNRDGRPPPDAEREAYLALINEVCDCIAGVHLYGLARQPMQPGAERLSPLSPEQLANFGEEIRQLGVEVHVSP